MCSCLGPMAQKIPMQDESLPQMDPKREMGAAAAAADFATPPLLRQIPSPVPSKTAHHNGGAGLFSPLVRAQMMEMITQAMRGETQQMNQNIIRLTQTMRGERRQVGDACRRAKGRRHVLQRTSWRGVHRRVKTGYYVRRVGQGKRQRR